MRTPRGVSIAINSLDSPEVYTGYHPPLRWAKTCQMSRPDPLYSRPDPLCDPLYRKAKDYAHLLLKFRMRSVRELEERLKKKGFDEELICKVVEDFKAKGLLDDAKFAKLWSEERMWLKPKGKKLLRQELKEKGVRELDINRALEDVQTGYNEYEVAKDLALKRANVLRRLDKRTAKRRLYGYLERRGFSYEVINKVVSEVSRR